MRFPLNKKITLDSIPEANRFGAKRKYDVHTGVDFFCEPGEPVYAIEDGVVTSIAYFTGEMIGMPWWNNTKAVGVEGKTGVFLYGEIEPVETLKVGDKIREGDLIGNVVTVLKIDKGLPMTMLHLELYEKGYRGDWVIWNLDKERPSHLINSEVLFELIKTPQFNNPFTIYAIDLIIENKVNLTYTIGQHIKYPYGGFDVNGYFIDYGKPTLGIAIKDNWIKILAHELSHMEQWIEKSPYWINSFVDGRESIDYIDDWINGSDYSTDLIKDLINRSKMIELDCEKRTIEKLIKYNLSDNINEDIQKAMSYIIFYDIIFKTRKWNIANKAPYEIENLWREMPITFDDAERDLSEKYYHLYMKYCY